MDEREFALEFLEDAACSLGWYGSKDRVVKFIEGVESQLSAKDAALAEALEALETAKEAMDERRSYVNGGNPASCWQEMKYGEEWDAEDAQVAAALRNEEGGEDRSQRDAILKIRGIARDDGEGGDIAGALDEIFRICDMELNPDAYTD